jgi:hypothetical protein
MVRWINKEGYNFLSVDVEDAGRVTQGHDLEYSLIRYTYIEVD